MARATGIEIGETAVTAVEIDGSPKKFRLLGAARVTIDAANLGDDRIKATAQAIRAALKGARAKREAIVVTLGARDTIIREIQLPFTETEQIRKVIKFESESHLLSCDIDDVVVGFHKISENQGRSRVMIFAVRKTAVRDTLDALGRAGVDPLNISLDASCLFSLWRALPSGGGDGAHVLIDIGEVTTNAIVTTGDSMRLVRNIRLGTDRVTRTVASGLGIDRAEAKTVTQQMAALPVFALAGDVAPATPGADVATMALKRDSVREGHEGLAGRLAAEVRRSLSSVTLDGRIESIRLTGVGAAAPGVEAALAEAFATTVLRLDTVEGVEHKLKAGEELFIGPAMGAALIALGHNPLGLDFRQEEFRFARKFDRVKWPLVAALGVVLLWLLFLLITEKNENKDLNTRLGTVVMDSHDVFAAIYGPLAKPRDDKTPGPAPALARALALTPEQAADLIAHIESMPAERSVTAIEQVFRDHEKIIEERYGMRVSDNTSVDQITTSALTRLAAWYDVLNKNRAALGAFTIDKLTVSSTLVTWTMTMNDATVFDTLITAYAAIDGKPEAVRGTTKPSPTGTGSVLENCSLTWKSKEGR